jgi:hypothetical protein
MNHGKWEGGEGLEKIEVFLEKFTRIKSIKMHCLGSFRLL